VPTLYSAPCFATPVIFFRLPADDWGELYSAFFAKSPT